MIKAIKGVLTRLHAQEPTNPNAQTQGAYDNMACCAGDPGAVMCVQENNGVSRTTRMPEQGGPLFPSVYPNQ